jgi:cell division protease FtsH
VANRADLADVGKARERSRRRRLWTMAAVLAIPLAFLWLRLLTGHPVDLFTMPQIDWLVVMPVLFFASMIVIAVGMPLVSGRSPHTTYRPEQIDTRLEDVIGIEPVKEDVARSLELFLGYKSFTDDMGGTPRRGLLFEGAPGTGKTYLAKAMAAEANVPFMFVSATSFQSMYYGATARKIRSYFKALRKAARQEGGAIGFIEEIDAIAMARGGLSATPMPDAARMQMQTHSCGMHSLPMSATAPAMVISPQMTSEGVGGVVNELLVQMQSFDEPTGMQKMRSAFIDKFNLVLPAHKQISKPKPIPTNVLLIAATNRADNLDPALLRPGRFDRRLTFDLPTKKGRRELVDHFLGRKSHAAELDEDGRRDHIASATSGYTPVMLEHLFDEALVNCMRRGETEMTLQDIERARLVEEVGLGQPVEYTDHETRLIATHEAGHATAAFLCAPERRLEILTIIKRRQALGLLAHGDAHDVYTRSRKEMLALIKIALAGQCAEEIFFGDISTGPGGDLLYATNVAAEMVGSVGMTGTLVSYAAVQNGAFNASNLVGRILGDSETRAAVENLLQEQKAEVKALLTENAYRIASLRDTLIEKQELIGHEITDVLENAEPSDPPAPAMVDLRDGAISLN